MGIQEVLKTTTIVLNLATVTLLVIAIIKLARLNKQGQTNYKLTLTDVEADALNNALNEILDNRKGGG